MRFENAFNVKADGWFAIATIVSQIDSFPRGFNISMQRRMKAAVILLLLLLLLQKLEFLLRIR